MFKFLILNSSTLKKKIILAIYNKNFLSMVLIIEINWLLKNKIEMIMLGESTCYCQVLLIK